MNLFSFLENAQNWTTASGAIPYRLGEHLFYTVVSVAIAAVIGIPLGILVGHTGRGNFVIIGFTNAARAIPTLGFVILMVLLLSSGAVPVLIVLAVLALPPILTATAAGVAGADSNAVHAARALGMTPGQVISKVEWPLALPLVLSGVRSATLQVVATATVAAYASAGGLGRFIVDGLASQDYPQMFAGALLVALLAIVLDILLGAVVAGLRRRARPTSDRRVAVEVSAAA
ncbi:osmoprotectant transport system permease protein [Friedmanniella endophytica]|uniref:Osmoprotectant transport system permease protein n=1 Tax=Microlunatus kandeliicorticis TaxID=1759536 RepID=A0A7W3P516_9ACTN|nr:ABC transporter permease subunit [Microlunatus kandeliicorticis]MBA8793410.1 osmoprotectant transport system permease protein [Microlunatus kandeliicorticis]